MSSSRWREKISGLLDEVVVVSGVLSLFSLLLYFLALHDLWHDFASPEVSARAGETLPTRHRARFGN